MSTAANPAHRLAFASGEDQNFRKFLTYSLILHGLLVISIVASIYFNFQGPQWGGIGGAQGAVTVNLVGPAAGIPMPPKPSVPDVKAVDPTKGLWHEEPQPKPEPKPPEPKTPAEVIPTFKKEKPLPPSHKSREDVSKVPPPDNAVNYGKGGPPPLPNSYAQQPGSGSGPVTVNGQGGGDFASRYAWYIEAVTPPHRTELAPIHNRSRRPRRSRRSLRDDFQNLPRRHRQRHALNANQRKSLDGQFRPARLAQL